MQAKRLEEAVWESLCGLLRDPQLLEQELARRNEGDFPGRTEAETDLTEYETSLSVIPVEKARLVRDYGKGLFSEDLLRGRIAELDESAEQSRNAATFAKRVSAGLDALTNEERTGVVRLLVDRITLSNGQATVRVVVPTDPVDEEAEFASRTTGQGGLYESETVGRIETRFVLSRGHPLKTLFRIPGNPSGAVRTVQCLCLWLCAAY